MELIILNNKIICETCQKYKPLNKFVCEKNIGYIKLHIDKCNDCKDCNDQEISLNKVCIKCNKIQPKINYQKSKNKKDGLSSWCKDCHKKYYSEYKKNNKETIIDRHNKWVKKNNYYKKMNDANKEWRKQYYQKKKLEKLLLKESVNLVN